MVCWSGGEKRRMGFRVGEMKKAVRVEQGKDAVGFSSFSTTVSGDINYSTERGERSQGKGEEKGQGVRGRGRGERKGVRLERASRGGGGS